jgi:hypothetical protein
MDRAVHEFELGTVSNPAPDWICWPVVPKRTRTRRIVLWRTRFPNGPTSLCSFSDRNSPK